MTRPGRLALLASLLGLVGCGAAHPATTPPTSQASTTGATTHGGAPIAEHAAVSRFAAAYVRFLDGVATGRRLPDATASVRTLAERAGSIPASRQRGTLLMTQLTPAADIRNSYLLTARDRAHAVDAQMTLAERDGRWRVTQLTPPDFLQAFAAAGPSSPPAPSGSAGAERAARLFLRGYLPWLYGQVPRRGITAATRRLLAGFTAHPPRIPPTMRALAPTVAAIAMQRRGHAWQAFPNVTDGQETYELALTVTQNHDRWLVSHVSSETR
jgi:hypothetical protein